MNGTISTRGRNPQPALPRARAAAAAPAPEATRSWLLAVGSAYLAFVVYGSLVPLAFRHLPWGEAVQRWNDIRFLDLGIGSRADWVANLLLFIPLAFFWSGVIWPRRETLWRVLALLGIASAGFALALGIEFVQIYFPPRTVSINDIVAETLGAVFGVAAWWAWGEHVQRWVQTLPLARGTTSVAKRLLVVYLLLFFGYNLLPLDLTISPVEIYHKWSLGKVILLPFSAPFESRAQQAYELLTDAAIWVPIAALWRLADRKPALQVWTFTVVAAVLLEFLQLFVFSRVSDITDVFTAAVGAAIGVALVRVRRMEPSGPASVSSAALGRALPWLAGVALWLGVLAVVFWYPFDFNLDRSFLRSRIQGLARVPFEAYYYGTEFRAVTEVLHKTLFMAPLGLLLHAVVKRLPPAWPSGLLHTMAVLLIAVCALVVEGGQFFLPGKNADVTDALLEWAGGSLGFIVARWVDRSTGGGPPVREQWKARTAGSNPFMVLQSRWALDLRGVAATALAVWIFSRLPGVPYNVGKLIPAGGSGLLAAAGMAVLLWWVVLGPFLLLRTDRRSWLLAFPIFLAVHALAAFVLIRISLPLEMLHKIIGSPILDWPQPLEDLGRYVALHLALETQLLGAMLCVRVWLKPQTLADFLHWVFVSLLLAWPLYFVVVSKAATDNLVELMRDQASMGAASAWAWGLFLICLSGVAVSVALARRTPGIGLLGLACASALGAAGLFWMGQEPTLVKYDAVFSGLQFVLSAGRDHYAVGLVLAMRLAVALAGAVLLIALLQRRAWRHQLDTKGRHSRPRVGLASASG